MFDTISLLMASLCFGNLVFTAWKFRSTSRDGMLRALWWERIVYAVAFSFVFSFQWIETFFGTSWLPPGAVRRTIFSSIFAVGTFFAIWALRVKRT